MYSVGSKLKVSLFGSSHGECVGCIIEGLPRGMAVDTDAISRKMALRKPSPCIGTSREEADKVEFEHGLRENRVVSGSVMIKIINGNRDGSAYSVLDHTPRPGHADLPALMRFKDFDIRGGGQFSGRMTAPLVAAGAIAEQYLHAKGIEIAAYSRRIHDVFDGEDRSFDEMRASEQYGTRAATAELDRKMHNAITDASEQEDSVGGIVRCCVVGLPIGFGGIWFDALDVSIARMMFSIPAVKGVEFGKGFGLSEMMGSESNDRYRMDGKRITASSNNMGGVCGGMSNGMPLVFDVAFKPTPSIGKMQHTVNLETMQDATVSVGGRHDPCIVPRAVPVVEAMAALAVMDQDLSFNPVE